MHSLAINISKSCSTSQWNFVHMEHMTRKDFVNYWNPVLCYRRHMYHSGFLKTDHRKWSVGKQIRVWGFFCWFVLLFFGFVYFSLPTGSKKLNLLLVRNCLLFPVMFLHGQVIVLYTVLYSNRLDIYGLCFSHVFTWEVPKGTIFVLICVQLC